MKCRQLNKRVFYPVSALAARLYCFEFSSEKKEMARDDHLAAKMFTRARGSIFAFESVQQPKKYLDILRLGNMYVLHS